MSPTAGGVWNGKWREGVRKTTPRRTRRTENKESLGKKVLYSHMVVRLHKENIHHRGKKRGIKRMEARVLRKGRRWDTSTTLGAIHLSAVICHFFSFVVLLFACRAFVNWTKSEVETEKNVSARRVNFRRFPSEMRKREKKSPKKFINSTIQRAHRPQLEFQWEG